LPPPSEAKSTATLIPRRWRQHVSQKHHSWPSIHPPNVSTCELLNGLWYKICTV
jgi:hypothetical protein